MIQSRVYAQGGVRSVLITLLRIEVLMFER